jgi:hypothetical protein
VLGVSVGTALWVVAPTLLGALGAVDALVGPGADYLRVRAIGVPFLMLTYVGHGAFRGASDTRTPLIVAVGSNVLNAVLTVLLVGPFGIVGVAAATVMAEAAAVVAFVVLLPRAGVARRRPAARRTRTGSRGRADRSSPRCARCCGSAATCSCAPAGSRSGCSPSAPPPHVWASSPPPRTRCCSRS